MNIKKGFTLVELISVITILSLLIIVIFPNVSKLSQKSNESIRMSKLNAIKSSGEKYGNASINKYKNCLNSATESELKNDCSISVNELVMSGYMAADDNDYNVIDPILKEPFNGRILFCYNPANLNIEASYVENDSSYFCSDIDMETGAALNLNSVVGKGYVGGDEVAVNIIKSGTFERGSFACDSSDSSLATCRLEGTSKMYMKVVTTGFSETSKEVKFSVTAKSTSGATLSQEYTLVIYPTSLSIDLGDNYSECLPEKATEQFGISSVNGGNIDVSSSDEEILKGSYSGNLVALIPQNKTGLATLTISEANGKKSVELNKRVFHLNVSDAIPEGFLLGNEHTVKVDYSGNNSVVVSSSNSEVVHFYSSKHAEADSIELNDEDEFTIKIVGTGEAKIILTGNPCGKKEYPIVVSNLYLTRHTADMFIGGSTFETEVVTSSNDMVFCESSDESVVTCETIGNKVILTPGMKDTEDRYVDVYVRGASGGIDTIKVNVKKTSINLVDEAGNNVSKVCVDKEASINSSKVLINGVNSGSISLNGMSEANLAEVGLAGNEVIPNKKYLNDIESSSIYKIGHNTGITNISVKESNGNQTANFDYYIYDIKIPESTVEVITSKTTTVNISTFTTGLIEATSSDTSIATVKVENPEYSYGVNQENTVKLYITGISTGRTTINLKGQDCGEVSFEVNVIGQTFYIKTPRGSYTEWVGTTNNEEVSCTTVGSNNTCEVIFPDIQTIDEYVIVGYSKEKDSTVAQYKVGEKLVLSEANNGDVYYANATDVNAPVCVIQSLGSNFSIGETNYINMNCIEVGSGIIKDPTPEDFLNSHPDVGEVVSVEKLDPMLGDDNKKVGEIYKIGVSNYKLGQYDLTLKEGSLEDKCGNKNESTMLTSVFASEFSAEAYWYVGKEKDEDVIAVLYDNNLINGRETLESIESVESSDESTSEEDKRTYSLTLYGTGEMKDFMTDDNDFFAPWYMENITNVDIKDGVTNIGNYAFYNLYDLESANIPDSIQVIGEYSFFDTSIKSIVIPPSVKEIKIAAFFGDSELASITLNDGLEVLGDCAFQGHAASSIYIPSTLKRIPSLAFASDYDNLNLREITFGENSSLEFIGPSAFLYHIAESLTIPASVENINHHAFSQLDIEHSTLKSLNFEENSNLKYIFQEAFSMSNLDSLELPASLSLIETGAFASITGELKSFKIGPRVSMLGSNFAYGKNLEEFIVDEESKNFSTIDGVLYNLNQTELVKYPDKFYKTHESLTVPDTVTTISPYAFYNWFEVENSIPVFELNLPSSILDLNISSNFDNFVSSSINIDSPEFKSRDGIVYSADGTSIYRLPTYYDQSTVYIEEPVINIEDGFAYNNMNVQEVYVPDTVTNIKERAFVTDIKYALKNIHINSLDNITIDDSAFSIYKYSESFTPRNIYVKSEELKSSLETQYDYMSEYLNVYVEE